MLHCWWNTIKEIPTPQYSHEFFYWGFPVLRSQLSNTRLNQLQLLGFLSILLSMMLQQLFSTICVSVRIVRYTIPSLRV